MRGDKRPVDVPPQLIERAAGLLIQLGLRSDLAGPYLFAPHQATMAIVSFLIQKVESKTLTVISGPIAPLDCGWLFGPFSA